MNIATRLFLNECRKRGIKTRPLCEDKIFELIYQEHYEYLYAQFFSITPATARQICARKELTKAFLAKAGISVAKGDYFSIDQPDEALNFANNRYPLVLKPSPGGHGEGVFANISDESFLEDAWSILSESGVKTVLLEEFFHGKEYRILATKKKVLGVVRRVPANVVGDGLSTISNLIKSKNSDPRRSDDTGDPVVKIFVDNTILSTLKEKKLALSSIPAEGERVFLRENSNISTGGESVDYTDKIDPSVKKIALKVINAIPGLPYAGIDFMTKDITKKQKADDYIIVEVNSSPGIDLHHFPYKGKKRNVASQLLNLVFPETTNNNFL